MTEKSRYWSPSRTYELILKIGKIDLTPDLISLTIISSVEMPYQTFLMDLFIDAKKFVREKFYGQTPIKLTVNLLATEEHPLESTEFELIYLNTNSEFQNTITNPAESEQDRDSISITAVPKLPYVTMNHIVNNIYQAQKIENVITDLVKATGATLEIDSQGINKETIDQLLIPPSTLYKNLQYLNKTWGIYDGLPSITCSYDNRVKIKNLTNKMKQAQGFTVYQFAIDQDNTKLIEKCNDGKNYYTLRPIKTKYEGNSTIALLGPKLVYLVKPRDRLISQLNIDTIEFAKKYGLISKNNEIFFDNKTIKEEDRITYLKDHTGYDLNQTFINSTRSKSISAITEAQLVLERDLKILSLMDVGSQYN
jgi:hypothetical protein